MKNNLHVFLGATVADAAARPLHWVYDQKKLNTYIKNKKDFAFLKNNTRTSPGKGDFILFPVGFYPFLV